MKRGRRPLENPRNAQFRLRMTQEEYEDLSKIADGAGVSKSEVIRNSLVLLKYITDQHPDDLDTFYPLLFDRL